MLSITRSAPDRIDIELNGEIDADIMRAGLDDLFAKSADIRHGRMLYRIPEFSMPTLGAIGIEISRLPQLFGLLGRFERCAVLSDAGWLRTTAELEGKFFPGLEIRSFALNDVSAAETWLAAAS